MLAFGLLEMERHSYNFLVLEVLHGGLRLG
ncbi:hypothetical protein TorRG33x02_176840 [Trema orientale]|uniref:Uncharacterized protein n=1 Tax=Trema orientale TaxID=63057 RepID=A0A2P5ELS3_TREOI|nr:hypothetical protein TorRG33x02_176840 [Trema orientale]